MDYQDAVAKAIATMGVNKACVDCVSEEAHALLVACQELMREIVDYTESHIGREVRNSDMSQKWHSAARVVARAKGQVV